MSLDDIVEQLQRSRSDTLETMELLRSSREQIEEHAKQLEGPKAALETVELMMQYSSKPMSVMPNAGVPQRVEGRNIYLCSPEYMAQYARRMLWAGVKIIGGCCGTTPEHIKLIRQETRSLQPQQKKLSVTVEAPLPKELQQWLDEL